MGSLENDEAQEGIFMLKVITKEFIKWKQKCYRDSSVRLLAVHA